MLKITSIDLSHSVRQLCFPYRLDTAGICRVGNEPPYCFRYENFELTLRLDSTGDRAVDRVDGTTYRTEFPSYILKRNGSSHSYVMPDIRNALFFIYSPETERELEKTGLLNLPVAGAFSLSGELGTAVENAMELLNHSRETGVADRLDLTAFEILQKIYFQQRRFSPETDSHAEKMKKIASCIEMNLNGDISIPELARRFGYSERGFFRHWSECFGTTPGGYLRRKKIERAKYLLKNTAMSVSSIALDLKFCDEHYFSATFKKVTGLSPREFRTGRSDGSFS